MSRTVRDSQRSEEDIAEDDDKEPEAVRELRERIEVTEELLDGTRKEARQLKSRVSSQEAREAEYEQELEQKTGEVVALAAEVRELNVALEEALESSRIHRAKSPEEFEIIDNVILDHGGAFSGSVKLGQTNVKDDLMSEIEKYEEKLKEKEATIQKLIQATDLNSQLVLQIQEMKKMVHSAKEEEPEDPVTAIAETRSRHDSFDVPNSFEPETISGFVHLQEAERLKEDIGSLLRSKTVGKSSHPASDLPPKAQKILDEKNEMILKMREEIQRMKMTTKHLIGDTEDTVSTPDKRIDLEVQEHRTQIAFLENEEAERETERRLRSSWTSEEETEDEDLVPCESVENLTERVKRELELSDRLDRSLVTDRDNLSLDCGLENLSDHIVESLLVRIRQEGSRNDENSLVTGRQQVFLPVNSGRKEREQDTDRRVFLQEQERGEVEELRVAVQKERQQSLGLMERLNTERRTKCELEEELSGLRGEVGSLHTQLLRHQEEIEELTALYESEKSQNSALEEAVREEKSNFDKVMVSLETERLRSRAVSTKDSDTILELRTALEVEKEHGSRLALESPHPGSGKLGVGSGRISQWGSRTSLPGHKSPALLPDLALDRTEMLMGELEEERGRCQRLKECLEMERERQEELRESMEGQVGELLEQLRVKEAQVKQVQDTLSLAERERAGLVAECQASMEEADRLREEAGRRNVWVEDLEARLEVSLLREEQLRVQLEASSAKKQWAGSSVVRNSRLVTALGRLPEEPQDQMVFLYRNFLRSESYRKALVWQKRYLSLLLSSYQEAELLSLGRLARMSGSRKMLVADISPPEGSNIRFRVVVHSVIAIHRMKFLVRRWKKTKRSGRKSEERQKRSRESSEKGRQEKSPSLATVIEDRK